MRILQQSILISLFLVIWSFPVSSQDLTTFILVRHAEKADTTSDTELSEAGHERAEKLAEMLEFLGVDAIYSTNFQRTKQTVAPLSDQNGVPVQNYDYLNPESTISNWLRRHKGERVVVSGHSNTTPTFTNALMERQVFEGSFDESDYGNLLIVLIHEDGSRELMHLRY